MRVFTILICLAGLSSTAQAEDRALLIGVGRSRVAKQSLAGVAFDLRMMRRASRLLGFGPDQVRVLKDAQATHAAVVAAIRTHLIDGVTSGDRVLLFFSGHGGQVADQDGDEADGADETWALTDEVAPSEPGQHLVDDELGELLARLPTRRVLVIVDACHSGTSTRALGLAPRFLPYRGAVRPGPATDETAELQGERVVIAAARDDETALDTPSGGLFTRGVYAAIVRAHRRGQPLTPFDLTAGAAAYIRRRVQDAELYHPRLSAPAGAARLPLFAATGDEHAARDAVEELARRFGAPLTATTDRPAYRPGEQMVLKIEAPAPGHLHVISVDAHDDATVLFPNPSHPATRVPAGPLQIPGASMSFSLVAVPPVGKTLIVVLYSTRPFRLPAVSGPGGSRSFRQLDLDRLQPIAPSTLGRTAAARLTVTVRR